MTRWLSADEQASWRAYLDASRLLFDAIDRRLGQQSNLLHPYYEVLVRLSEAPHHTLRMSELADNSRSSRSRISHAIARMEERGWVERFSSEDDRRAQWARLTELGMQVLVEAAPDHVETVRRLLLDPLTEQEFAELGRISAKLRDWMLIQPRSAPDAGRGQQELDRQDSDRSAADRRTAKKH